MSSYSPTPLNQNLEIKEGFIANQHANGERIEFFFIKPADEVSLPVIFIIHGSQPETPGKGAQQMVEMNYLQKFANEGVFAIAISMPGYGRSDGVRDFCGPHSQKAIAEVIHYFSRLSFVDPSRMGIYGISKGAILSSMIHKDYPYLTFQILEAGSYDLLTRSSLLPLYLEGILKAMTREAGDSAENLKERSAVYHTHHVIASTLILHGEIDDRKGLPSAMQLHELLLSEGKESTLKIFPNTPHRLPEEKWDTIIPFLKEKFQL